MAAFAATGVILSAVYMLWMFQRVNYGPVTNEKNRSLPDLTPREWALMIPTVAMCIFMGVFPNVFLRPMEPAINKVIERVHSREGTQVKAVPDDNARPARSSNARPEGRAYGITAVSHD
jgi:NADH-quinone oxidoreductase subunit M